MRVVIVGAGLAGLSAAVQLIDRGFTDLVILEAENRIGGRVHTVNLGDKKVDLGAHWVHGESGNVVFGMSRSKLTYSGDFLNTYYVTSDKTVVPPDKGNAIYESVTAALEDKTALQYFDGNAYEFIRNHCDTAMSPYNDLDLELKNSLFGWIANFQCTIEGCDTLGDLSTVGLAEYHACEGDSLITWKEGGFETFIDILLRTKTPNPVKLTDKILLNKVVNKIDWSSDVVKITCQDGSEFTSDYAIVTVSLGVLQQNAKSWFTPPLPKSKLNSIMGLGFGSVTKVYLEYEAQWWPEDCSGFNLLYSDLEEIRAEGPDWIHRVVGFYTEYNLNNCLCMWLVGPEARSIETYSATVVMSEATKLLKTFVGHNYNIPNPLRILMSNWCTNPNFLGTFSFRSMKSQRDNANARTLSEPLYVNHVPRVLFAGEATHRHYYSTAHGAVESGQTAADRIYWTTMNSDTSILIIGAGLAGLSAAKTLLKSGFRFIKILEATSKVGGRVQTMTLDNDEWIDLGAQWIHGKKNLIYDKANDYDLLSDRVSREGEGYYMTDKSERIDGELVQEVDQAVKEILCSVTELLRSDDDENLPTSFRQVFEEEFCEFTRALDLPRSRRNKHNLLDWHKRFQMIDNSCADLENMSAKWWGQYRDDEIYHNESGENFNFKQGFSSFVNAVTEEIPEDCFVFNSPVKSIEWKRSVPLEELRDKNVKVTCTDGVVYEADHVIFTPSIGYLKAHKDIFSPHLPEIHLKMLDAIGFDNIVKIYLIYNTPWWSSDMKGIQLVWDSSPRGSVESEVGEGWIRGISGFDTMFNSKNILVGWAGGKYTHVLEATPEQEVGTECTSLLRQFLNRKDIPEPNKVVVTKWGQNEYVQGSYSYIAKQADKLCSTYPPQDVLNLPIFTTVRVKGDGHQDFEHPSIILAGEGVHRTHYSTAHGAFESGKEQATELRHYINWFMDEYGKMRTN